MNTALWYAAGIARNIAEPERVREMLDLDVERFWHNCEAARVDNIKGVNLSTAGSINNGSLLESMRTVMAVIQNYGRY